jgi:hypothetical protein
MEATMATLTKPTYEKRREILHRRYGRPIEHRGVVMRRLREDYPHVFGPPKSDLPAEAQRDQGPARG